MIAAPLRALRIVRVLFKHRLDALLEGTPFAKLRWVLRPLGRGTSETPRGERLRAALEELGPIFVKFGQILSTRRDLLPPDVADALALLRDRVQPFDGAEARRIIEAQLGQPIDVLYAEFDETPLASASIAQVHAARLRNADGSAGRAVVVKVVRPGIDAQIDADLSLLKALAEVAAKTHPRADKIRPHEVVAEIETTLRGELDLQREGANASVLRRFWIDSDDLYVPEVFWTHSHERVLTLERVTGIPSDDIAALEAAGISRAKLAADAHAGNIWVDDDPARRDNPRFIALDFGIMGQLSANDQYYLAENFMAIFQRDYRRIAELHVEAGWMPAHLRLDDLEAATRAVCEPYFTRPLAEISLGEVLVKLFKTAQQYELTLQPQLILLQKTLLNIEGVARHLDPKLDIWAVAQPVLTEILKKRYSAAWLAEEFKKRLPEIITRAPEFPRLIHGFLSQQVEGKHRIRIDSTDIAELARISAINQRAAVYAILGAGLMITAAVLFGFDAGGPAWGGVRAATWIAGMGALACFVAAWPRRR
jgi:ubiquinone biosynthesis protein